MAKASVPPPAPFEQSLARLQEIVEQLEDGRLSLGESLAAYEEGIKHLKTCHEALAVTERKIELLAGFDAAGNAMTQPFDDAATDDGEGNVARRSRTATSARTRSAKGNSPAPLSDDDLNDLRELF